MFISQSDIIWLLYQWQYFVAEEKQTETIHLLELLCVKEIKPCD